MDKKIILEVSVDRLNEKGVFIAEQILNVLYNALDKIKGGLFRKDKYISPDFSFEIVNENGIIRFFFVIEKEYKDLVENQIYAHFPNVEIKIVKDHFSTEKRYFYANVGLSNEYIYPIKIYKDFSERTEKENMDPFSSITSSLIKGSNQKLKFLQINFSPIPDDSWKSEKKVQVLASKHPKAIKKFLLSKEYDLMKSLAKPIYYFFKFFSIVFNIKSEDKKLDISEDKMKLIGKKFESFGFACSMNMGIEDGTELTAKISVREIASSLNIFTISGQNGFTIKEIKDSSKTHELFERRNTRNMILSSAELAGIVHLPTIYVQTPGINWVMTKTLEPPNNLPPVGSDEITPIGFTNFRGSKIEFGIGPNDRRRHIYILGKTGMGKSTILENMIFDDILKGRGVALIDPHGDLAETIVANIPKSRTNDVIYFDPADYKYPVAFNMFESVNKELRPLIVSGIVGILKKMFENSWGPRLEHFLRNTIITLMEMPDSTLMSIPLILTNKSYRLKIIQKLNDPMIEKFWMQEFEVLEQKQMTEAVGPILNKVGQFLSSPILRNVLSQPKNAFSFRWIMDNKKIFIANLSKGKIGEDSMMLLGSMMVTKFQIDAMSRADIPEDKRKDFYLYVDEFQNFATDSFAVILSEARKYKLNLTIANQFIEQMTDNVRSAVFGNVGSTISFQVGPEDAPKMVEVFGEDIVSANDLQNIRKYDIYTKLLIDGMPTRVFSATTFPPLKFSGNEDIEQKKEKIIKVSREKYAKPVEFVEKKILELNRKIIEDEKKFRKEEAEYKERMKEEKKKKAEEAKNK